MDEKQFDSFLGGSQELPHEASILKTAVARASEAAEMSNSIENPQQNKLIFQKLPRHMRRRVMSHNVKRMPRRLRESHHNQMSKSGLSEKNKVPSRKHRRRPRNLLLEYNRRKRDKFWLETHIWHAKRFKMLQKWGFKLAEKPNDKCFRANYRAVAEHSLIQDISYYTCLEISGPLETLIEILKQHSDPSFNFQQEELKGEKEGTIVFYKKNSFPLSLLGNINFIWKPDETFRRTLWLWIHPGSYQEIFYDLVSSFHFQLVSDESDEDFSQEDFQDVTKMPSAFQLSKKIKLPLFRNEEQCEMKVLRNLLNRFRICGPLTLCSLTDALKMPKIEERLIESMETDGDNVEKFGDKVEKLGDNVEKLGDNVEKLGDNVEKLEDKMEKLGDKKDGDKETKNNAEVQIEDDWYRVFYSKQENREALEVQRSLFERMKSLKSPDQIEDHSIIALTVLDPRFFLAKKRTKSVPKVETEDLYSLQQEFSIPDLANRSGIWETENRVGNRLHASQINKMRHEVPVPGLEPDAWISEEKIPKIPILLIQKPGIRRPGGVTHRRTGFASGFDLIIPEEWALPFWLAIIFRCVRAGGLQESRSLTFETLNMSSPEVFHPGSPAYERESIHKKQQLKENYLRHPPNRRANYTKFAISSPFFCEWEILTKEWQAEGDFFTLRNEALLRNLDENLTHKRRKRFLKAERSNEGLSGELDGKNCLVPVKVTIERKGVPEDFAVICLPTEEDLESFRKDRKWSGPVESEKVDPNEKERVKSRKSHLEHLKRLRKQRVRRKKMFESLENESEKSDESDNEFLNSMKMIKDKFRDKFGEGNKCIVEMQAKKMEELWLPKCSGVRHSCDREVIGYVEQGAFCFSEAKGVGRGYVVLEALKALIGKSRDLVLIRNTQSREYKFANLQVIVT